MIHIVDTNPEYSFGVSHIMMKLLSNAITDLAFASDDSTLAIGCGDKAVRLVDMQTQKVKTVFENHTGCIKQVRFRPGDDNIIASCCRDGIVNLWDARCKGDSRPVITDLTHGDTSLGGSTVRLQYRVERQVNPVRSWRRAHSDRLNLAMLYNGTSAPFR